eukprot:TRINITY_DN57119_c0_g1_i1.p1 TRINITY_DN57119_c0_g1~~TRINITY_DN57119_c0_g1_i1.p1  ORF type:complete len:765 (+),score=278.64 TRINITY_DN57119_c0_g1_i1:77-2296(+)
MSGSTAFTLAALAAAPAAVLCAASDSRSSSLRLQAWSEVLDGAGASDTPVTRVVKLLEGMTTTLNKEMDEDKALYGKLKCWCNDNQYEKDGAATASRAKIAQLESDVESFTAKASELKTSIGELEAGVAADKQALNEAQALRDRQLKEAHDASVDSTQAIENLKAAIVVLSKHHEAPPESTVDGGAVFKSERDSWSFLAQAPGARDALQKLGLSEEADEGAVGEVGLHVGFLQQHASGAGLSAWPAADMAAVTKALQSAAAFVQGRGSSSYYPSYQSQSGNILGVLKQLKEEMEGSLSEAQKLEASRAATFAELREAKREEIANGEQMAERKEGEHADTVNKLAEAKEDLGQEKAALTESERFLANLKTTCDDADKNFEQRKAARLAELQAVSETIGILKADDARDAISATYSFVQRDTSSRGVATAASASSSAAAVLRRAANHLHSPRLSVMASSVELDSFAKVKKAIDDMVAILKTQQADEVKKNDWCKGSFHENDVATAKETDAKASLEAKIAALAESIKTFEGEVSDAQNRISQLQLELQRASEDRLKENHDFQQTVADQTATVEVLKKALEKLATYYDLAQTGSTAAGTARQTPPVPQMEYSKSKGAGGVMELLKKLIQEAGDLKADAKNSENNAQAAYEQLVADTNDSVKTLQNEVVSKTKAKGVATKDKLQADSDLTASVEELEGLSKYNAELHGECDYLIKNFDLRQQARQEEIDAMQQAKQILSGAAAAE